MQLQTIFKAGNSNVVTIPKHLLKEVGLKHGQKVTVNKSLDNSIVISKTQKRSAAISKSSNKTDFKKWLDVFLKENSDILDELAVR